MPIEKRGNSWRVRARWTGIPPIEASVDDARSALTLDTLLRLLRQHRRLDILNELATGGLDAGVVRHELAKDAELSPEALREEPLATKVAETVAMVRVTTVEHLRTRQAIRGLTPAPTVRCDSLVPAEPPIGELVTGWLSEMREGRIHSKRRRPFAESSVDRYEDSWEAFFAFSPELRTSPPSTLTSELMKEFRINRELAGADETTVNRDFTAVSSFLGYLKKHKQMVVAKPEFEMAAERPHEERYVPFAEIDTIEKAMVGFKDHAQFWPVCNLSRWCGLRIDEAQGLRRMDVIIVDGRPTYINVCEYKGHKLKGGPSSARRIGIPSKALPVIEAQLALPGKPYDRLFPGAQGEYHRVEYAFTRACIALGLHDHGAGDKHRTEALVARQLAAKVITKADAKRELERVARKPRIAAKYTLHSLRHSFGVACAQAGMNAFQICHLLGHQDVATTQRYVLWSKGDRELTRAAEMVEAVMSVMDAATTRPEPATEAA